MYAATKMFIFVFVCSNYIFDTKFYLTKPKRKTSPIKTLCHLALHALNQANLVYLIIWNIRGQEFPGIFANLLVV